MTDAATSVYTHSGDLGKGLLAVPAGGAIATALLSIVYAYLTVYSPIVGYITVVFLGALVGGLGFVISRLARVSRCRNVVFLRVVGLACGILALYTSWVAFEYALLARFDGDFQWTMSDLLMSPATVWQVALDINQTGWFSIFGFTPSGTELWLIWGIEAIIVVAGPAILATMGLENEVFCDRCNRWCDKTLNTVRLAPPETEYLQELRADNLAPLYSLRAATQDVYPFLLIDIWRCGTCNQTNAMRVNLCMAETDDDETAECIENLTPIWLVEAAVLPRITAIGRGSADSSD